VSADLERAAQIAEELTAINRVPEAARAMLEREVERLLAYHTEKCCDPRLSARRSARHKEARLMARGLLGFYEKRKTALLEELRALRQKPQARRIH